MYLPTVRESTKKPSLSDSSSAMRPSPQLGFSCAMVMMSARRFFGRGGRPTARDFQRQNSRNPARYQRMSVLGLTIASACVHGENRLKTTRASFAAGVGRRRFPAVPGKGQVAAGEINSLRLSPHETESRDEPGLEEPPMRPRYGPAHRSPTVG
jgi:hypothetical protein